MAFWANDTLSYTVPENNPCGRSYDGYVKIDDETYEPEEIDYEALYEKNSTCLLRSMELFVVCAEETAVP